MDGIVMDISATTNNDQSGSDSLSDEQQAIVAKVRSKICTQLGIAKLPAFFTWTSDTAITHKNLSEYIEFLQFDKKRLDPLRADFEKRLAEAEDRRARNELTMEEHFSLLMEYVIIYPVEPVILDAEHESLPSWYKCQPIFSLDKTWSPQIGESMIFFPCVYAEFANTYHPDWQINKADPFYKLASVTGTIISVHATSSCLELSFFYYGNIMPILYVPPHETPDYIIHSGLFSHSTQLNWQVGARVRSWFRDDWSLPDGNDGMWSYGVILRMDDATVSKSNAFCDSILVQWDDQQDLPTSRMSPWELELIDSTSSTADVSAVVPVPLHLGMHMLTPRHPLLHKLCNFVFSNFCRGWPSHVLTLLTAWSSSSIRSWGELQRRAKEIETILPGKTETSPHIVEFKTTLLNGILELADRSDSAHYTSVTLQSVISSGYRHLSPPSNTTSQNNPLENLLAIVTDQ